jgi:hypothetical protein
VTERPTLGDHSSTGILELLMGGRRGQPEQLLLIERPSADGQVRFRQWTSADWSAPPSIRECSAAELLSDIERAVREGRGLNRELTVVRHWLAAADRIAP